MTKTTNPNTDNHPISVVFVVTGTEVKLRVKPDEVLGDALDLALKKSKNTGQPIDKWEVKNEAGELLAIGASFAALGLGDGSVVFATLSAGAAG